jgi:hypothetical protein
MKYFCLLASMALLAPAQAEDLSVSNLTFNVGEPWKVVPTSSPMRKGTVEATVEGSDVAVQAVFYYFGPGQGGDVEANIQRWLGQFDGEPKSSRDELEAGDAKISIVDATGTYMDGPPFGAKTPKPGHALLGAIVPAADANVFIKLTGPEEVIGKLKDAFRTLVSSPFN